MGWVEMSERELCRAEVLAPVFAGRPTTRAAAGLMGVSGRKAHRLARQFAALASLGSSWSSRSGEAANKAIAPDDPSRLCDILVFSRVA